jgi:UDP-3-O-[3-hydroxymyristoyl] glucosamine N-acyltransferase
MTATLAELAERFDCALHGSPDKVVGRVGSLLRAGPDAITFLANPQYRRRLADTRAAAVILEERYRAECPVDALVTDNPYAVYARVAAYLHPPAARRPGIHPSAVVADGARVAESAEVSALVVVGAGSEIGDAAVVGPGCVIGANVRIGAGTRLAARATVLDGVVIGARCVIDAGAVIGSEGYGFAPEGGRWIKVPQLGGVIIGDDVEIGANTTVDRGTVEDTVIEAGVKIDNLVQIAHNVRVGEHTVMAGTVATAGSARIGKRCMIAGGVGIVGHITVCDDVVLTARALVTRSIDKPGTYSGALHAEEAMQWRRNAARFRNLDSMAERLRAAERALERMAEEREIKEQGRRDE